MPCIHSLFEMVLNTNVVLGNQRQGMENLSKASRSQEAIADEAVSKSADFVATLESQVDDLNIQLTAAQSGSQDAAKAAEKVELLLAFIDKQGSGDTSNIHIHKNYGHGGPEVRKNWNKCRGCQISYDEIQDLKASLKD